MAATCQFCAAPAVIHMAWCTIKALTPRPLGEGEWTDKDGRVWTENEADLCARHADETWQKLGPRQDTVTLTPLT